MNLQRRSFLRASGVALALPALNAFADESSGKADRTASPRRMLCICAPLGLHPDYFFPSQTGKDYQLSPYLKSCAITAAISP